MFGVKLPLNFNSPYKSKGIIEFWQRWHMTLTRYLTLLLFNPISLWVARRRQEKGLSSGRQAAHTLRGFSAMVVFPTVMTMLLAGIWHGAGLQFVIYGLLHGAFLSINHAWRIFFPPKAQAAADRPLLRRLWSGFWPVALTYLAIVVTQIVFRADSTADALSLLAGMIGVHGSGFPLPAPPEFATELGTIQHWLLDRQFLAAATRDAYDALTLPMATNLLMGLGLAVITFAAPNVYQIMGQWSPALTKVHSALKGALLWRPSAGWAVASGVLLFCASVPLDHAARFLYFQF
jgi:hypothetical protein